jgi:glutaconyl-CoA/methylmalonyl-CoA decarboxylase subunit gamma
VRYFVTLDPAKPPLPVDVTERPNGTLEVRIEGRPVDVDALAMPNRAQLSVRVGGRMVDLTTEGAPPEVGAVASGRRAYVRVESERMRAADLAKKGEGAQGEKVVKSPMPGRVVKVLVAKGDRVQPGQGLLVVEAMKMENEIRSRAAGTVAEVHVVAGNAVEGNAKLVTFV